MVKQDSGFWSSVVVVFCPCCAISLSLLSSFSLLLSLASDPIPLPYPFFPLRALPVRPAILTPSRCTQQEKLVARGEQTGRVRVLAFPSSLSLHTKFQPYNVSFRISVLIWIQETSTSRGLGTR